MIKTVLQSRWFTPIAMVLLVLVGWQIMRALPAYKENQKELANLQKKVDETKQKIAELEEKKELVKSESYLERQARLKLNVKMPDEKVAIIYNNQYNPDTGAELGTGQAKNQTSDLTNKSFWEKILDWIK
jgi:cell division protein FtsB